MAAGKMEKSDRRFYFWAPRRMLTLGVLGGRFAANARVGKKRLPPVTVDVRRMRTAERLCEGKHRDWNARTAGKATVILE